MQKTPVSILQEMMVKKKIIPNYELIYDGGGTHDNTFTYQVSCDGLVESGTGRCKKDAKHEAAKAMLEKIAAQRAYPQLPASPSPSPVKKTQLITNVTVSPKRTNVPFLNAIGALTQLCVDNYLQVPEYKEVDDVGPPHARIFTVMCTVSTFKEEGVATTKKQAKHEAARKMLEKIQSVIEDLQNSGQLDLLNEEIRLQQSLANEEALERYSKLTKLHNKKVNLGMKLEYYHTYLKKNYNEDTCFEILKQLADLKEYINDVGNDVSEEFINEMREKITDFLNPLNVIYYYKKLETRCSTKCLMLVEISTSPDLTEIGIASNHYQAERNAVKQLLEDFINLIN